MSWALLIGRQTSWTSRCLKTKQSRFAHYYGTNPIRERGVPLSFLLGSLGNCVCEMSFLLPMILVCKANRFLWAALHKMKSSPSGLFVSLVVTSLAFDCPVIFQGEGNRSETYHSGTNTNMVTWVRPSQAANGVVQRRNSNEREAATNNQRRLGLPWSAPPRAGAPGTNEAAEGGAWRRARRLLGWVFR